MYESDEYSDNNNVDNNGYCLSDCSRIDEDGMVQCDVCDNWYHFECVGVTEEEVEDDDFVCLECA